MDTTESSKYILGQITVRVLEDNERPRFDELLEQRHYLKSARVGGRSLRYVAELNGDWIALICFSKQLYLRSLDQRAQQWLSGARLPAALAGHELDRAGPCPFKAEALGSLLELFKSFKDSRRGHGLLHRQCCVLACTTVTMLMGADSYQAMEDLCGKLDQRQLRALGARKDTHTGRYRAPSDSTFFRVLGMVDTAAFDALVGQWMSLREPGALERIAVDGKTLRGSKRGEEGKALQLLSAVTHRLRLTIAQREIEAKSNEIL